MGSGPRRRHHHKPRRFSYGSPTSTIPLLKLFYPPTLLAHLPRLFLPSRSHGRHGYAPRRGSP